MVQHRGQSTQLSRICKPVSSVPPSTCLLTAEAVRNGHKPVLDRSFYACLGEQEKTGRCHSLFQKQCTGTSKILGIVFTDSSFTASILSPESTFIEIRYLFDSLGDRRASVIHLTPTSPSLLSC